MPCCASTPKWSDLYDQVDGIELEMLNYECETGEDPDLSDFNWALRGTEQAQREAQQFFRRSLVAQELTAYVEDSKTKQFVALKAASWKVAEASFLGAMLDDYGGTIASPSHPDATVAGVKHRVFFSADDFNKWMTKKFPRGVGRPRGSGSWDLADQPLLREMQELIVTGKASSPFNAANQVVQKAAGSGTIESKIRRLERRYMARNSK
jgi:hypothetical protein